MKEESKIKLAMLAERMYQIANDAVNTHGQNTVVIYTEGLKEWSQELLDIINYEMKKQEKKQEERKG